MYTYIGKYFLFLMFLKFLIKQINISIIYSVLPQKTIFTLGPYEYITYPKSFILKLTGKINIKTIIIISINI